MSARVSPAAADEIEQIEQIDDVKLKPVAINMDRSAPLITLSWENINVYNPATSGVNLPCYKSPGIPEKHIVKNACGIVKPGTLTAIMGASGAGKTTLLNVLNFRNRGTLRINGDVKINGSVVESREALASLSGYVQQEDLYIGTLKVKEQLKFQAFLRMDNSATDDDRNKRVEDIMHDLNLKKCEDTIIGSPEKGLKGISGGERRRLAFACEMITNPNLMFFDEPTSGLDSFMALSMVESMRKLAKEGKTIICTIHQPSSEVFEKFDRLLLMAEGRLAYLGPLKDANTFFASQGFACPRNYNPADFYIQNLAMVVANREASLERINKICDGFQQSAQMKALEGDLKAADALASNPATAIKLINRMDYKVSFVSQFIWVLWREMLASSRDKFATQFAIFQTFLIALIIGLTFLQLSYDQAGVQNLNGVIFLMLINTSMNAMFNTVNTFPAQIPIFMREHQNGLYSVIVYYLSKFIIDLPKHIILPFITVTIVYWMANCYYDVGHFFLAAVIIIYTVNVAVAFGTFLSAVAPSANAALAMNAPLIVPLMIFSGFFLNNSSVPKYLIWCRYLSWWNYAFELLSVNQWQDVTTISCNAASSSSCYNNGADVLTSLDMHSDHTGINWMALSVIFVGWRVLAFVVLFIKSFRK